MAVYDRATRVGLQDRRAGEGYLGNFDPRLFFAVGGPGPFRVVVRWPSGAVTSTDAVAPDREITVWETAEP